MTSDSAAESGHWYTRDGKAAYEMRGRNGLMRPTTLRDARKLGLLPSVTTINALMAAPALERWKREQAIYSALTMRRPDGMSDRDFIASLETDSREQTKKDAAEGSVIHGAIHKALLSEPVREVEAPFAEVVLTAIAKRFPGVQWETERPFANLRYGYGGCVDIYSQMGIVLDYKTKPAPLDDKKCTLYDNHFMQTAAYAHGIDMPEASCGIVFVTRPHPRFPPEARLVEIPPEDTIRGWKMFHALLDLFRAKTGLEL